MPEVGDSLGRYTLLKKLAAGGMGEVFLAAKPGPVGFGPRVALKVLREQLASDQTFIDMLVDEANISMFLNHQNVVSVLDLAEDGGTYYIAMEYVQGVTVESLLERLIANNRKLDTAIALYITTELCRALKHADTRVNHAGEPLNIIHRDVTPANILLSTVGEVKLTDFGIARAKGRIHQTQAGVLKGKFGYMAPEMIRYEAIDARADLFCAGVVIYLMLTGRHPVAGATVMEAIQRYEEKQIPKPSSIHAELSPALDQIVMRALEPQPDNRWPSAAALAAAVQDVVLKNPSWRRDVQDGAQRLSDLIREIAPEMFHDPVPAAEQDRMLREALAREGIELPEVRRESSTSPVVETPDTPEPLADTQRPPVSGVRARRQVSGPATDRGAEALQMESFNQTTSEAAVPPYLFDTASSLEPHPGGLANPDLETEEGLALADVFAARQELLSERVDSSGARVPQVSLKKSARPVGRPRPDTGDIQPITVENAGDDIPTGVAPQEATLALPAIEGEERSIEVGFPDSSTDRHRLHEELINEPALPRAGPTDRSPAVADDGRTIVGMYAIGSTPQPTVGAVDMVEEPMREGPVPEETAATDDGKTVMGMMPDWGDSTAAEPEVGPPPSDPEATRAYYAVDVVAAGRKNRNGDDAETVIPLGPDGKQVDLGDWARDTHEAETNDATLLDGMDSQMVSEAIAKQRAAMLKREAQRGGDREVDPAKIDTDSDELNMDEIVASSMQTGKHAAVQEKTIAGQVGGPALLSGPVRISFRDDGSPTMNEDSGPSASAASAAAMLASNSVPDAAPKKKTAPVAREKKRVSQPDTAEHPNHADVPKVDVGAQTGRWMAGQLDAGELAWDDDAAARRAVATRNQGPTPSRGTAVNVPAYAPSAHPQPRYNPAASVQSPHPMPLVQNQSSLARNWPVIAALAAAFLAVGVVTGVLLFTQVLWPKLKLESDPPGATVIVDGVQVDGRSPVTVKVEPEKPHSIEFRLDGHHAERREITDGVGRGRTYALQVSLRRVMPQLDMGTVQGIVFVNDREVGRGTRVALTDLPLDGTVRIRVEAQGYRTWETTFERGAMVPETVDVGMVQAEPPKEPPKPTRRR